MKHSIGTRTEINTDSNIAISVKDLHKSFKLPTEQAFGLKQAIFNRLRGIKGYKEQKVLKGLSFEIKKGEFLGIVGRNGSGKSTLLKMLAGIYYPEKGEITVNGTLVPFIELGVGFNPELTGRENVYMNGALLGFSNEEMDTMYDDIWEFAELKDFQDQKLKNYSSGMQVRLAFSIAIRAQGNILLLDEVLAVGDAAFQQKCSNYFAELKDHKQTVILVTHSMDNVRKFCDRAILIEAGEIIKDGDPKMVADAYTKLWS
ncbi:ABC transporter ATP-binding protein [Candidatus Saccharibacteria bacterium]|nr:ABC transporter ATP-binding protein [Candidatus Saccharibacteria bacterium]